MKQQVFNFARFYAVFNRLECLGGKVLLKCHLVKQYTNGRTESLREMTMAEYNELCSGLERTYPVEHWEAKRELKKRRSEVLHQMQLYGLDTSDWATVDKFTCNPRIAGKRFARLNIEELALLHRKLRAMRKKQANNQEE